MTLQSFYDDLKNNLPDENLSPYLKALWYDGKGNWDKAHEIAQDTGDKYGAWIHAYLHRKEGDLGNASFWYRRANTQMPKKSLEEGPLKCPILHLALLRDKIFSINKLVIKKYLFFRNIMIYN